MINRIFSFSLFFALLLCSPLNLSSSSAQGKGNARSKGKGQAQGAPGIGEIYGEQRSYGEDQIRHSFLITGPSTAIIGEDCKVLWTIPGRSRDGVVLPNANVLVSVGNQAQEHHPEKGVVWSYRLDSVNKELGTVFRLDNGNTLVVERGVKPRLLEIDKDGKIAVEVPLQPETDNAHLQTRMARKLPNGNYLVPHLLAFKVKEYTPEGKIVKVFKTDLEELGGRKAETWPFTAIRLENGNTLVTLTHGNQVVEFDQDGSVAWRASNQEVGNRLADPCGAQRLPNGHTVICSYAQKNPKMPKLFEIKPDLNTVWEYYHPKARAHEVHIITTNGRKVVPVMK